jgi:hypothetical protein
VETALQNGAVIGSKEFNVREGVPNGQTWILE